jgi:hypothetical protein
MDRHICFYEQTVDAETGELKMKRVDDKVLREQVPHVVSVISVHSSFPVPITDPTLTAFHEPIQKKDDQVCH